MAETAGRSLPRLPGLIAGALVVLGLLLDSFVAEGFLVLAGLGAFGPGILRELRLLKDHDEFQRQAAHRAGYHAYLIGGFAAVLVVAGLSARDGSLGGSSEWVTFILLALWMTWLFSTLLSYWGARKTASRVLIVFGSFWAVFVIADIVGSVGDAEPFQWLGVLMAVVVVAPFFALAFTAGRWPRLTGALLLVVSAAFLVVFGRPWAGGNLALASVLVTATLLLVPLIATGIALLGEGARSEDGEALPNVAA